MCHWWFVCGSLFYTVSVSVPCVAFPPWYLLIILSWRSAMAARRAALSPPPGLALRAPGDMELPPRCRGVGLGWLSRLSRTAASCARSRSRFGLHDCMASSEPSSLPLSPPLSLLLQISPSLSRSLELLPLAFCVHLYSILFEHSILSPPRVSRRARVDLEPPCTISPSHPHHLYHLTTLAFKCAASRSLHVHKTNAELFFHMTAVLTIAALTVVRLPACCPITQTLAEKEGGADILGAAGVGLTGTIPVVFRQGNDTLTTMATAGQPLSSVAAQAGQYIKYKCRKGECGTCAVRVDGQWIKTCSVSIPFVPEGESYEVFVRGTMVKPSKSSRFFSFKSFIAGFRNNFLGMVGFVKEGPLSRKGKENFSERINAERELAAKVAARKAARARGEGSDKIKAR
mmetsp:Transcript_17685/g.49545  ORF Transcript_17685/g.49545 Transcript_17685/m.49545 type:complete len:401 (-) Transcript_17685:643-1845(-)